MYLVGSEVEYKTATCGFQQNRVGKENILQTFLLLLKATLMKLSCTFVCLVAYVYPAFFVFRFLLVVFEVLQRLAS